uniref:Sortilin 1b n=1 Tax=Oncorhynchus kisutch TaxID=8019 RepID=A0A8C7LZZ5_ONCKI
MGILTHCVLLFLFQHLTSAYDFKEGLDNGQYAFVKDPSLNIEKRSADVELFQFDSESSEHIRSRRSADQGDCKSLQGFDTKLTNNTHTYSFNDLSGSVSLAWVGDATGVILALTTFQVPFFMLRFAQSKLYRSENYGKSFQDVTNLINNTFIRTEFGIAIGPENSGKVILTGDVSGSLGSRIFISRDFGNSFEQQDLPFNPLMQITYNPRDANVLLVTSNTVSLGGGSGVGGVRGHVEDKESICLSLSDDRGMLDLRRTTDYGKTIKTVATKIFSFGLGGKFLFASVMTGTGTLRRIHVSTNQGDEWNMAQLPPVGHEEFYSILAANEDMVFMHVDEPGDTGYGTIYVSDDRGTVYSKSLERHLYTTTGGDTDFTNVTSLRGVFITSILAEDGSVQSVVSFDQGGEWVPLQKPANTKCDSTAKDPDKCSLHIHAAYSEAMKLNVPMLPLSEPNAVGLIMAHGSVGDVISVMKPDVFVSDDGGYTWLQALEGPHHYAILDSGGLLVAVEHSAQLIKDIKFSTDEGQCWHVHQFTSDPIHFTGLAVEPGARSMNVSVWGYRDSLLSQYWVSVTVDFRELLTRTCEDQDYVQWLAHSDDISDPNDGCMLGYKEKLLRLRKASVCWNGRDYEVNKQPTPCLCTLDDFLCDFGYYRKENSSECVEQPDLKGHLLEFCLQGKEELLQTRGYRKIPGDKCEGGTQPERKEIDLSKRCVSDLSAPIIVTVLIIVLLAIIAGVLIVKKYVCGGRFLVHSYSVLQQHAEAQGLDEPLDSNHTQARNMADFHDDSDEVMLP